MKVPLADLRTQYLELKPQIDQAISEVIESGHFSGGAIVERLENEIAKLCGARYGVGVASGTDALVLSLRACDIGPGDEVITTPFTFGATTEAIALVGAAPVYVDIDPCTFNMDLTLLEGACTPRTRAVLPVDLYGQLVDRAPLMAFAAKHDVRVIIDSAQAAGASRGNRPIAADADATTLSFYPTKNLGAFGDGGMVLTNDAERAEVLRSLRGHGTQGHKYHHVRVGYCSRLDAIQAAALLTKLPHLAKWNRQRRDNAALYNRLLADIAGSENGILLPCECAESYHIYHQYTVRHPRRDALKAFLKSHDVDTDIYYPLPLHLQPAYAYLGCREGSLPVAETVARECLSLPVHPELKPEQIEYVCDLIHQFQA